MPEGLPIRYEPLVLAVTVIASLLAAHPSATPPAAWPLDPKSVGEVVSSTYTFRWVDTDFAPTETGTPTVDWFFTDTMPPTFQLGIIPAALDFVPIVRHIPEFDRTNEYTWDTSTVAAGSYFLYSLIQEPMPEPLRIVAFSRGVLTIAHPGDPIHPAVAVVMPDSPFHEAAQSFEIVYEAFDPDGTASVKLEATQTRDGTDFIVLGERLRASGRVRFQWDTSSVAEGDWTIRATLTDGRGLSFTAYSLYLLRVQRPLVDAGTMTPADAGRSLAAPDASTMNGATGGNGSTCSCRATPSTSASAGALWLVGLLVAARRKMLAV